jgi:hypothetical protein
MSEEIKCECGCTEFTRFGWASVTETIDFATDEIIQMEVEFSTHLNGGRVDFRCCECDKVHQ